MKNPNKEVSYKSTTIACYTGNFVQALITNITPILFITLREQFGLSFQQLGFLVLVNFITQVICDIAFSGAVDRYGFRPFAVAAPAVAVIGLWIFSVSPYIFDKPYIGFVIGTVVFSGAGGLLELLLSPIVNAIPTDEKAAAMSALHSFYAWGQVTVVLLTTLGLLAFGRTSWQILMMIWTIVPLLNFFMFLRVPLAPPIPEEHRIGMRELIFKPFFIVAFAAILFGGASEVAISQWTSSFMEKGLNIPKIIGDTAGVSMFAFMLGLGRLLHGIYGNRINLSKVMTIGCILAILCYMVVAFSTISLISLIACALSGFAVSLLWPGTLTLAAEKYPMAGTWMFAILAAGGDIGASVGPWLIGFITDNAPKLSGLSSYGISSGLNPEQLGLRSGMFIGTLFPIGALICLLWISKKLKVESQEKA